MPTYQVSQVVAITRSLPGLTGRPLRAQPGLAGDVGGGDARGGRAGAVAAAVAGRPGMKSPSMNHSNSRGRWACQ